MADVPNRLGTDLAATVIHVCFTPKSGHWLSRSGCPLCAKSRHWRRLFDHFINASEQRRRHGEAEHPRSLKRRSAL